MSTERKGERGLFSPHEEVTVFSPPQAALTHRAPLPSWCPQLGKGPAAKALPQPVVGGSKVALPAPTPQAGPDPPRTLPREETAATQVWGRVVSPALSVLRALFPSDPRAGRPVRSWLPRPVSKSLAKGHMGRRLSWSPDCRLRIQSGGMPPPMKGQCHHPQWHRG